MDNTGVSDMRFDIDKHTALKPYKGKSYPFTAFGGANMRLDHAKIIQ